MDRAAEVAPEPAASVEDAGLAVGADVVEQPQVAVVVHEHQGVVGRRHLEAARLGDREPMTGVAERRGLDRPLLGGGPVGIGVGGQWQAHERTTLLDGPAGTGDRSARGDPAPAARVTARSPLGCRGGGFGRAG